MGLPVGRNGNTEITCLNTRMKNILDILLLFLLFGTMSIGIIYNWLLKKEVTQTRPLNVTAPSYIFSILKFNIILLSIMLLLIILAILYLLITGIK